MRRRAFVWGSVVAAGACTRLGRGASAPVPVSLAERARSTRLDTGWRFLRADAAGADAPGFDDSGWERVSLPHTARVEALVTGEPGSPTFQWQGLCWYRRTLRLGAGAAGKKVFLRFDGAMNVADVWLDGVRIGHHMGGFLPFVLDVSDRVTPGRDSTLAVRLDNRDDPITGPKPLQQLDFNTYGGLYRDVHLVVKDRLHITDPIFSDHPAGGGVFVTYPEVSERAAVVRVQTQVRNDHPGPRTFHVRTTLLCEDGSAVAATLSEPLALRPGTDAAVVQRLDVARPRLWSPRAPRLYTVRSEVVGEDGAVADAEETRVGMRRISFAADGFRINGERLFLRGTNRHQEYPYVGYAVPDDAQYRDARKIKEAGFDYVRLSHYPQSPAFLDACDELGLVVMDSIPGWQYFGSDPGFAELQYRNCRELIRRDRNHACVVLWEVSLNETQMPAEFVARTHAIAHEEYPGDQCYTCGWVRGYDVFIRARQHGGCAPATESQPCLVSEYGDWEYYAMTAGMHQEAWERLTPDESNSRKLRWHGERAMLQQASNFQEAHDDNLGSAAIGDGLWVMYDYNRGYAPDIESSGCMDIFRLPKYSYHFFRSQRSPSELVAGSPLGVVVFVASEWTPASSPDVRVFANCDEVELRLNGAIVGRRGPDRRAGTLHLAHPPFTFSLGRFAPGTLEAVGYLGGREAGRHVVRTPGAVEGLRLDVDRSGRAPGRGGRGDVLFCHASLEDASGTTVASAWENVAFGATGSAALVGATPFSSDGGIASILARLEPGAGDAAVHALSIVRGPDGARVVAASAALVGAAPPHEIRFTADGRAPGPGSPRYGGPTRAGGPLRTALVVAGRVVATLDENAPKFRIRGSAAPGGKREPFRHG